MSIVEILIIALALAVDAFTVGAAVGLKHGKPRQLFRLSFHFGLFQALMPLLGALLGNFLGRWIEEWSHWIAFGLLALIGGRMILGAVRGSPEEKPGDPTRGLSLIGLSLAVSIDALAVGFTLGLEDVSIPFVVSVIGVSAAALTFIGMRVAGKIGARLGKGAEIFAGVVLVGLGAKILLTSLL